MSLAKFPDDMVSGSAWAEQIGVGYTLFNPMPMIAASTRVAMLMPTLAVGTAIGLVMGASRIAGVPEPRFDVFAVGDPVMTPTAFTPVAPPQPKTVQPKPARATAKPEAGGPVKAPAPKAPAPKAPAPKASASPASASPAPKTAAADMSARPAGLEVARGGKPDDLQRISGIGPKLEMVLNDLGIYHFDQIAAWTVDEVAWIDTYLKLRNRITRDNWIAQADALKAAD